MTDESGKTSVETLHAYIDGRLDADARRAFEARMEADPELAADVAGYQRQIARLREAFGSFPSEPFPAGSRQPAAPSPAAASRDGDGDEEFHA